MALNLADRIAIIQSPTMQARCTAAVAKYALYLLGGTPTSPQESWATGALKKTSDVGRDVSWYVLDETNFLDGGSDITDGQLQARIEAAINDWFIQ